MPNLLFLSALLLQHQRSGGGRLTMGVAKAPAALWLLLGLALTFGVAVSPVQASRTNHYDFFIKKTNVTRLCHQKTVLTVNGKFPGPTIYARKDDVIVVNVYNQGDKNITIHWHGVDQPQNPWFDGPEYITQCPIQPGANFTYRIIFTEEEGTLWWHAHSDLDSATVHGAIVVHPRRGSGAYPYKKPHKEIPVILGEWWNEDVNKLLEEAKRTGSDLKPSEANTINGQPGDLFPCSKNGTFRVPVKQGKTYLLRIINAGLTNEMFFSVAGHPLMVVGTDGRYLKPFTVESIMISPGQTMNALLMADRPFNNSRYYMAARTFSTNKQIEFNNSTATAIVEYTDDAPPSAGPPPDLPDLPAVDDADAATAYTAQLRSLVTEKHPVDVPANVEEHMLVTLAINVVACLPNQTCEGPNKQRFAASLNNISFAANPAINVLDAYYYYHHHHSNKAVVYEGDFPNKPSVVFNFTDPELPPELWFTKKGTKVKVLEYGTVVEVAFQNTGILGGESHPMHLHGFSFYVVGRGFGIFDAKKAPASYNLVDPPYQNTVSVPKAGWVAIRFRASNPGVWFMHCHFDRHNVWGMDTVFIVKDGKSPEAKMMSRPPTMPKC